jgi:hypothetical protein
VLRAELVRPVRGAVVRRAGGPCGELAGLIVARTRIRAEQLSLGLLWASDGLPQLEGWIRAPNGQRGDLSLAGRDHGAAESAGADLEQVG